MHGGVKSIFSRLATFKSATATLATAGVSLMQIGEWFLAITCWVVLGFLGTSRAIGWWGESSADRKRDPLIIKVPRAALWIFLCVLAITITHLRKPEGEPWTNLQKLRPRHTEVAESRQEQPPAPVSLWVDCDMQQFPMSINAGGSIHVLLLHPRAITHKEPLFDVLAFTDKAKKWPSEQDAKFVPLNVGDRVIKSFLGERCTVKKYGTPVVDNISLPIVWEGSQVYFVSVDPLDSSSFSEFTFYLVNGCPYTPYLGKIASPATAHILGETGWRNIEVHAPPRGLPALFLSPTYYHWLNPNVSDC